MKFFDLKRLINFRRDIHKNAEISLKEFRTKDKIIEYLKSINITDIQVINETGILAKIVGKSEKNGKNQVIAFRADTDALETFEGNEDLPYRSTNQAAHLCGHDGHITALLGGISLFMEKIEKIPKNKEIRLIF